MMRLCTLISALLLSFLLLIPMKVMDLCYGAASGFLVEGEKHGGRRLG